MDLTIGGRDLRIRHRAGWLGGRSEASVGPGPIRTRIRYHRRPADEGGRLLDGRGSAPLPMAGPATRAGSVGRPNPAAG